MNVLPEAPSILPDPPAILPGAPLIVGKCHRGAAKTRAALYTCPLSAPPRTLRRRPAAPMPDAPPPSPSRADAKDPPFTWTVRIYYEDTDAAGVVYYANYLRFFERCRTEWLRELGFDQAALAAREGVVFVVASAEAHYRRPARLDDVLQIDARIAERHGSHVVFAQDARRGGELVCHGRVKVVCVDSTTLRPVRLPPALAAALGASRPDDGAVPVLR